MATEISTESLLLTSTVVASVIAAIAAIVSAVISRGTNTKVKKMDRHFEIEKYKYEKIYNEYLNILEIETKIYENVDTTTLFDPNSSNEAEQSKLILAEVNRSIEVNSAFNKIKPMLFEEDRTLVDKLIDEERKMNEQLYFDIQDNSGNAELFHQLRLKRGQISDKIKKSIYKMLENLYSGQN